MGGSGRDMAEQLLPWTVLCCDGGGVRGIFQATLLAELDKRLGLLRHFNATAGVSTGALVASAISINSNRIDDLADAYRTLGANVFIRWRDLWRALIRIVPRYSDAALVDQISEYFGDDEVPFGTCQKRCLIAAVSLASQRIQLFDSSDITHKGYRLVDVLRASSAAPTYFAPADCADGHYIDGGVGCNNPCMEAVVHLIRSGASESRIKVMSVGTCAKPTGHRFRLLSIRPGILWARPVIDIAMNATADLASKYCKQLLGSRYLRLDGGDLLERWIGLDDYKQSMQFLPQIAREMASDPAVQNKVRTWLSAE